MHNRVRHVIVGAAVTDDDYDGHDDVAEAGHVLGLSHDAVWGNEMYSGHDDGWSPVSTLALAHITCACVDRFST
jgi:hypothetical protein